VRKKASVENSAAAPSNVVPANLNAQAAHRATHREHSNAARWTAACDGDQSASAANGWYSSDGCCATSNRNYGSGCRRTCCECEIRSASDVRSRWKDRRKASGSRRAGRVGNLHRRQVPCCLRYGHKAGAWFRIEPRAAIVAGEKDPVAARVSTEGCTGVGLQLDLAGARKW